MNTYINEILSPLRFGCVAPVGPICFFPLFSKALWIRRTL